MKQLFPLLFLICSGVSGSELKERSRTLSSTGQSCGRRTTFDLLQPCWPGKRVVLPQRAKDHCFGAWCSQDLTSARGRRHWESGDGGAHVKRTLTQTSHLCVCESIALFPPIRKPKTQLWMYQSDCGALIMTRIFLFSFCMWLETQPRLTYESVQNYKLFILGFLQRLRPLVKYTDCSYYCYSYLVLTIFICIEQSICIFVKKRTKKQKNLYK